MAENANSNSNTVVVNVAGAKGGKSNASWICGLIGFLFALPNFVCSVVCAAAVATAVEASGDESAAVAGTLIIFALILPLICFILGFFGKTKISIVTGLLIVLASIAMAIGNVMTFSFCGLIASILFLSSGISSICNYSR